jgi:O-methyltransferase involved in polyketide biosynthesis
MSSKEKFTEIMGRNSERIPHSALYTSATWKWAKLPYAPIVTPAGAEWTFRLVNFFMFFYRIINPEKISLKHNLLHRHIVIDMLASRSGCRQVIEVAAGFSPRGCMMSEDPTLNYIEIDLNDVVALKRRQLERSDQGKGVLRRANYTLHAGDINALHFEKFQNKPTFVISEGIMMYIQRDAQIAIWRNIASFIRDQGGEYVFDYIPIDDEPARSRIGQFLSNVRHRLTNPPPPFAYDDRTRQDVINDLVEAGFSSVEAIDTGQVAIDWRLPYSKVKTRTIVYHCRCVKKF